MEAAAERLGIDWPVAFDADLRAFRDYGCLGWPSLFLWGKGGALRWYHLGEGEYAATEEAIREQLEDGSNGGWPDLVGPLRPGDEPGAEVIAPTPEVFPGGSEGEPLAMSGERTRSSSTTRRPRPTRRPAARGRCRSRSTARPEREVEVAGPALYELAAGERHARHHLSLRGTGAIELHSIQFAPGPAWVSRHPDGPSRN